MSAPLNVMPSNGATADNAVPELILASASRTRSEILGGAGVTHRVEPAEVDEGEIKESLKAEGAATQAAAISLAEIKAREVARRHPEALVIGADQILECGGVWFDKPADRSAAEASLRVLRGRAHALLTGVAVVRGDTLLWHQAERATMVMRDFTDKFLAAYLDEIGDTAFRSVGGYQLEGLGAQLFSRVEGDYFAILGLPLLPLLDFLRGHGIVRR